MGAGWRQIARRRWLLAAMVLLLGGPARAAELEIGRFVGHWRGDATSEADNRVFVTTHRDLDLVIERTDAGFAVRWTTIIEPDAGTPRRRDTTLRFLPGPQPGQFVSAETFSPFTDRPSAWGFVQGNELVIEVISVAPSGSLERQTYRRALTGDVMDLRFTRAAEGKPTLIVTGQLTRQ